MASYGSDPTSRSRPNTPGVKIPSGLSKIALPHGDHFHVGESVVFLKDATGLINQGVWAALERKGLIKPLWKVIAWARDHHDAVRDARQDFDDRA